jgi:TPP-dependent 2-oxoacid decarboxylase
MKLVRPLTLALVLVVGGAPTWAAQDVQHKAHHPAGSASAPASKGMSGKPSMQIALMDTQMKAMGVIHDKLMAAKTPEERNALMAEHMQAMQDGVTMMNGMAARGMTGMKGDMAAHHRMMDKRMEMMQATMQMMMDRLPQPPAKQ